jgi:hypothetical protein
MRTRQSYILAFILVFLLLLPACQTASQPGTQNVSTVPPEIMQKPYLFEVARHLYRWHLDESEVDRIVGFKQCTFWVHRLENTLDPCDRSVLGEIIIPQMGIVVKVKKADYTIEDLGAVVKSRNFKITRVTRGGVPILRPRSCELVEIDMKEMLDYLFRTRSQRDYPDAELLERLRQAVRKEVAREGTPVDTPPVEPVVHLAPLSPVANDAWVLWEDGRKLFYFASDIELVNPAVWEHEDLMVRIFDLDQQVLVSHEEFPGSNRFLTRYQTGRVLFNCVVLGRRIMLPTYVPPMDTEKKNN